MILDKFKLDGKTAIVTGSNRGIGQYYAKALAEAGADIIGVSYECDFADTKKMVEDAGRKMSVYCSDFSNRDSVYQFVKDVKKDFEKVDILINNAGTILRKPISEHPDEYWDKVIEINLTSQFILTREFGKDMAERGYGKVVFIASLLSFQGGITVPGYAASKGGIVSMTLPLAEMNPTSGLWTFRWSPGPPKKFEDTQTPVPETNTEEEPLTQSSKPGI